MENLIEIKNVRMKFPIKSGFSNSKNEFIYALNDVSLDIQKGEILGLVGESGCGKSTLGKCVLKLYDDFSGEILYKGENILLKKGKSLKEFRKSAQMIFQNPYASLNPRMTIYDILKEPLLVHGIKDKKTIKNEIDKVCELTGISKDSLNYYPHEFSGGQRQRISIASAIILKPDFIVADEPVSALDVSIRAQIINLLKDLVQELNLTLLFISHDLSVVRLLCDRIAVMYLGEVIEKGMKNDIFENPKHPYTEALLNSVPIISKEEKTKKSLLEGDVPSPRKLPDGCKFHTRCPKVMELCKTYNPEEFSFENNHTVRCNLYKF